MRIERATGEPRWQQGGYVPRTKLVSGGSRRLVLLAPARHFVPSSFANVQSNFDLHQSLVFAMQAFRGGVYLEDGAIQSSELDNGRHCQSLDDDSWHLLILDESDQVLGCIRCREHSSDIEPQELTVSHTPLARSMEWKRPLENAVRAELALARRLGIRIVELGGLALDRIIRGKTEALRMALGMYALCQQIGEAIGLSTVTQRHCSASILRRIGGQPLESDGQQLPPYYDSLYNCQMELMRFRSWEPNPRYRIWVDEVKAELMQICVLTRPSGTLSPALAYTASQGRGYAG